MSLRRSARAPTAHPGVAARHNTNSSASSVSSSRLDRSSRLNPKISSPQGSIPPKSQTPDDTANPPVAPLRRTRTNNDEPKSEPSKTETNNENVNEEEEGEEEEETRCICGHFEYPGLPMTSTTHAKANAQIDSDPISEDSTGWYIQCDACHVWQHGGCVGILAEEDNPENYYCEQCRKDLHEVATDPNGRKYSRYLPAQQSNSSTPSPVSKGKDATKRTRESRLPKSEVDVTKGGRRATMNSRDSAYDEAEQLRRAIEESKRDSLGRIASTRKGKRSRSESVERDEDAKRRRPASASSSSQSKENRQDRGTDDEVQRHKNMRGAAARNHRAKENREREAREKERSDTNKRKNHNHKRKADEPDLSPEPTIRTVSAKGAGPAPKAIQAQTASKSHKKGGRPPARKGRLGRNQYSKDRDPPSAAPNILSPSSNHSNDGEPAHINGANALAESNGLGKPSKPRHMNPNRTTLNDMKRRVAGILEFISHTQVEMAALDAAKSRTSSQKSSNGNIATPEKGGSGVGREGLKNISGMLSALGETKAVDEEAFGKLNAVEMMEVLTRRLMRWQAVYGKYGEK